MKEYEFNYEVMGTSLSISIVTDSVDLANDLAAKALLEIQSYEKKFSRFLTESELSQLNIKKELIVSKTFIEVLLKAKELFIETGGAFNPLVQIERFGYDKDFKEIKDADINKGIVLENYDIDFSKIVIDQNLSKVILSQGQKLDFGGFLKGYVAEKVAWEIKKHSEKIKGVIVNIGGDIACCGLDENNQKFIFDIYNPINEKDEISIVLYNECLATSGVYKRVWRNYGQKIHHILNKFGNENPETEVVSVSVIHKDGGRTDAYTKAILSLGHENFLKTLGSDELKFIIIKNNGEIIKKI
jgi:FAD:protein FMN transferase